MDRLVVGIYEDVAVAQTAVNEVLRAGVPGRDVSILSNETIAAVPGAISSGEPGPLADAEVSGGDLVPRLTNLHVDRSAAEAYAEQLRRGGALVAVRAEEGRAEQAADILERAGALDFEAEVRSWRDEGWAGYDPAARPFTPAEADAARRRRTDWARTPEETVAGQRGAPRTDVGVAPSPHPEPRQPDIGESDVQETGRRVERATRRAMIYRAPD
jgi:hypothetical protein